MRNCKKPELLFIPEQSSGSFSLKKQYVSFEKDNAPLITQLEAKDYEILIKLYETDRKGLKKAIELLLKLKEQYPNCTEIYNLLSYFYIRRKRVKKADQVIQENYKTNPSNLIAKINYGDYLLRNKKLTAIEELFDNKYDLRDLFPGRQTFHISEFRGFMVLMGLFHLYKKNTHKAECYHYLASRVDKDNHQVKFLRRKLCHRPYLKKIYDKIRKKN